MSAYEQKVEAPDRAWQYVLFAAEPYETIAFKIPNHEIDKDPSKFQTTWNDETKTFALQLFFKAAGGGGGGGSAGGRGAAGGAPSLLR